jgi:hypothetical protein
VANVRSKGGAAPAPLDLYTQIAEKIILFLVVLPVVRH